MFKCLWCGKELEYRSGRLPRFCRDDKDSCYQKWYYANHKEKKKKYCAERHRRTYIPHPVPRKYETKEEAYEAKLKRQREWYYSHREIARQRNYDWYIKHKDDPKWKERHKIAMNKYLNKKRKGENL